MKTTDQIKSEISAAEKEAQSIEATQYPKGSEKDKIKDMNQVRNRLRFLRNCLGCLSTDPREEFVKQMRNGVIQAQKRIEDNFQKFYDPKADNANEMRQSYYAKENYATLSSQLKMLNYLLNNGGDSNTEKQNKKQ